MTPLSSRGVAPGSPLDNYLRNIDNLVAIAEEARRYAQLLKVAHWISADLPGSTELIVTVDELTGKLNVAEIRGPAGPRWTDDTMCTCPDSYCATHRADMDGVIADIEQLLAELIEDEGPREQWILLRSESTFRVRLPTAGHLEQIAEGTPAPPSTFATPEPLHSESLARVRATLNRLNPASSPSTRPADPDTSAHWSPAAGHGGPAGPSPQ